MIILRRHRRTERGAALILMALSLVATISVTGLVVDGGNAFAQRRQMQNAADAAALAGTRALDKYLAPGSGLGVSTIWSGALARAISDGADTGLVVCRIVDDHQTDLGACPTANGGTLNANADGVHITVAALSKTAFIRVAGINNFTARADATATMQALRSGVAPFVICAVSSNDPRSGPGGDGQPNGTGILMLGSDNIDPAAIGRQYKLQDPQTPGCGQGNNFKDLSAPPNVFSMPGFWSVVGGDHGVNIQQTVISGPTACVGDKSTFDNCIVAVPLCYAGTVSPAQMYCVKYAAFLLNNTGGASRIAGKLLGDVLATGGQGGGKPNAGEIRLIKLTS